nr:hypothetical protein [Kineosporia sp. R_H_3]
MTSMPGAAGGADQEYRYVPPEQVPPFDPLRLCIFATVSLITWLVGPVALVVFAGLGLAGYVRARRAGLTRSKCFLRDTRLVIGYLGLLAVVGVVAAVWPFVR